MTEVQLLPEPFGAPAPQGLTLPAGLADLQAFRAWARSPEFPERGRIDWVGGVIEADMSPEDLFTHGTLKGAIFRRLAELVEDPELGMVFTDRTRISSVPGDVSAEPDVVVHLHSTREAGHARLIPKARPAARRGARRAPVGRFVEIEGAVDLVVECVSDDSKGKEADRLRPRFHAAGIREYWIVDAREQPLSFQMLSHQPGDYREVEVDALGFRWSPLLELAVRLRQIVVRKDTARYVLEVRGS